MFHSEIQCPIVRAGPHSKDAVACKPVHLANVAIPFARGLDFSEA